MGLGLRVCNSAEPIGYYCDAELVSLLSGEN